MHKITLKWPKMSQNGPNKWQKEVLFYFLGYLKAKLAEIWCQDRFLRGGLGDFDFGHF